MHLFTSQLTAAARVEDVKASDEPNARRASRKVSERRDIAVAPEKHGPKSQTVAQHNTTLALLSPDTSDRSALVRLTTNTGQASARCECQQRAKFGRTHRSIGDYSITSSARTRIGGEIAIPIALAVFRLTTSSNLVGCSTGKSPGFAPLAIMSTNSAARLNMEAKSTP
jgi:hypothetical protein